MSKAADVATSSRHSVRYRLLAIALSPMLVILPLLLGISIYRWNAKFDAALISRVNAELTIARQYLARSLDDTEEHLVSVTSSAQFQELLRKGEPAGGDLGALLIEIARKHQLDFLYIVGNDGRIIASEHPMASESVRWNWPIINSALHDRSKTSIDVFEHAELSAISSELAEKARIEVAQISGPAPAGPREELRGLILHSAAAMTMPDGQHAALVGGILLNNNVDFVDTLNDLIYHNSGLPEDGRGTVTLFLDDLRVSTNVRLFENRRAIGTRASAAVRSAVLEQGRTWLDSAFVVNDWYISGYEPIRDSYGRRVGMLYAGFIQRPFADAKRQTLTEIALAFLVAVAATVPLFLRWASEIFRPLERMTGTIVRVERGELDARTGPVKGEGEIAHVAMHLDHLLDEVQLRDAELRQWNEELNHRVDERTKKLQLANQQLEATTKQLIMSEKLAAIGEIMAGVAHEINNPIAVMQGNLEVIRDLMGSKAEAAKTEFALIDGQMHRISEIVTRLLQFAKPEEYAGYSEKYDLAHIIGDTLPLVQHLTSKSAISVDREFHASRLVDMNRTELQQVLVNLMVNAIYAMPEGGRLTLRTSDRDEGGVAGVVIEVRDIGSGIAPDIMKRIFDPFFTTKRREGTGLGLSVCQMLVSRHGGKISVESELQKGTTFAVWLPAAQ